MRVEFSSKKADEDLSTDQGTNDGGSRNGNQTSQSLKSNWQ